jgi:D-tyrosyl-tRNA(Tyr) deacylase
MADRGGAGTGFPGPAPPENCYRALPRRRMPAGMHLVLQRVRSASVEVGGQTIARIGPGVLLLVGVEKGDEEADADVLARKVAGLRIFPGRTPMDRTLAEVQGACLVVSQFTLAASLRKGKRPGFDRAEGPERAEPLYLRVAAALEAEGLPVARGRFGAAMAVHLENEGPFTLLLRAREGRLAD